ncbi:hypothetical protein IJM16_00750 [Candidatus Saccharibacteria bacterium]|nr:hypothetical protein [Candidatus Saccharibacteria bacterium]
MNVLYWGAFVVLLLLLGAFVYGVREYKSGVAIASFVLALIIAATALVLPNLVPPRLEKWQVSSFKNNTLAVFDGKGDSMSLALGQYPHANYEYKKSAEILLMRDVFGRILMISPKDGVSVPKK